MTSVKLLRTVHWHPDFIATLLMASELTGLKSSWLLFLENDARESVPDTHNNYRIVELKHRLVQVCRAERHGPQKRIVGLIAAAVGQWQRRLLARVKAQGGDILNIFSIEFSCSSLICQLNSTGLCNVESLTLLLTDFVRFMLYYRLQHILWLFAYDKQSFANICYTVSCRNYSWTKRFENCRNISTDSKVTSKIKLHGFFFLRHSVYRR